MKIYADTSVLFSLYVTDANSAKADLWRQANPGPLDFTGFHRMEMRNALSLAVYQKRLTPARSASCLVSSAGRFGSWTATGYGRPMDQAHQRSRGISRTIYSYTRHTQSGYFTRSGSIGAGCDRVLHFRLPPGKTCPNGGAASEALTWQSDLGVNAAPVNPRLPSFRPIKRRLEPCSNRRLKWSLPPLLCLRQMIRCRERRSARGLADAPFRIRGQMLHDVEHRLDLVHAADAFRELLHRE